MRMLGHSLAEHQTPGLFVSGEGDLARASAVAWDSLEGESTLGEERVTRTRGAFFED